MKSCVFKIVFQYQMAKFNNEKLQLLLHQLNTHSYITRNKIRTWLESGGKVIHFYAISIHILLQHNMLGNFDQCVSLGKTVSICPASFCTPRPNLFVIPGISSLSTFAFQSPMMERTSFWGVIEDLVGLHVLMWELDYKESWVPENWFFWTMLLEKTLESPVDWKEIQPVHPKWNQSWIFIGRTDAEAETPILWPPDAKSRLIEKTLMLGKIEGKRRRWR